MIVSKRSATFTRPADTDAYAAADIVGATAATVSFANVASRAGAEVRIFASELQINVAAIPSGMTSFTLYLYDAAPASDAADNAAFDLVSGDRSSFLGSLALGTPADLGSTLYIRATQDLRIRAASTSLYAYLVTAGAFTPGSEDVFKVTLHIEQEFDRRVRA